VLTFVLEDERPFAHKESSDGYFGANVFNFGPILELNEVRVTAITARFVNVQPEGYFGFNGAILFVAPAEHIVGRHRRMVADLLEVNGTAVDPALESFSEDRVERLLAMNAECILRHHYDYRALHSLEGIFDAGSLLYENGSVELTPGN